jgi:hypothetical protein
MPVGHDGQKGKTAVSRASSGERKTVRRTESCSDVEDDDREEHSVKPPGQFMEKAHEADTKRFVEQARKLARRRAEEPPAWDYEESGRRPAS